MVGTCSQPAGRASVGRFALATFCCHRSDHDVSVDEILWTTHVAARIAFVRNLNDLLRCRFRCEASIDGTLAAYHRRSISLIAVGVIDLPVIGDRNLDTE